MKSTSDLFNEMIPLGRLIQMVNQKKDRLLNDYLSPMDITATQFRVLCSIRCEVCITPVELKTVLSVDPGAMTRMLDRL
ncbi:MarR family transcriptional regulator, partial [Escherichia coli]|nr:MarR family transcriptional regulator [Escherichia coli]